MVDTADIARRLTPAMREELQASNPGEGPRHVVGALVRRYLLTPEHQGSLVVYRVTALGRMVLAEIVPSGKADPFAGIDENTEYDATRPAVS